MGSTSNYEGDKAVEELPRDRLPPRRRTPATPGRSPGMDRPNGICFSPDESRLYVVDVGDIRVFDMDGDSLRSTDGRFVDMGPGGSDGIRTDRDGNLWSAADGGGAGFDGVHCYAPDGDARSARSTCRRGAPNLCFGGVEEEPALHHGQQLALQRLRRGLGAQQP